MIEFSCDFKNGVQVLNGRTSMYKTVLALVEFGFLVDVRKLSLERFWILVGTISFSCFSSWRVVLEMFFRRELLGEL